MVTVDVPEGRWDSTGALLWHGYTFIDRECRRLGSDVFTTRLIGNKTICMQGHEAARLFYDEQRFKREGALPGFAKRTLTGEQGVQTLDNAAHRHRRRMITALTTASEAQRLAATVEDVWSSALPSWAEREHVVLLDEVRTVLLIAVCRWAGVPLADTESAARADQMAALIDGFGSIGRRQIRGRIARRRAEAWISRVIADARSEPSPAGDRTPAAAVAMHRDLTGALLPRKVAAVDLLNLVRPVVAVGIYIAFTAHALHTHPGWRERIRAGDDEAVELFVQEVRRHYPFTPLVGARVRNEFRWAGRRFAAGTLTLLDVYGTLHDHRLWERPYEFRPDRFKAPYDATYTMIPQGGGDAETSHRCAGETITVEIMKRATIMLCRDMTYRVPPQDLTIDHSRVPTFPASGFVLTSVAPHDASS